jgi:hypothetical protein
MSSSNSATFFCNCTTFESVGGRYATPHRDATYCITSFFNGADSLEDPIFVRIVSRSIVHLSQESTHDLAFADTSFGAVVCPPDWFDLGSFGMSAFTLFCRFSATALTPS